MRLKGVGSEHADLLEGAAVDSPAESAHLEHSAGQLTDIAEGGGSVVDKAEKAAKTVAENRP